MRILKYFCSFLIAPFVILLIMMPFGFLHAQNIKNNNGISIQDRIASAKKCDEVWDVLWPLAKDGNLEARAMLFITMAPPWKGQPVRAPGNYGDYISKIKDITIMGVYAHDYKGEWGGIGVRESYKNTLTTMYKNAGFENLPQSVEFLKCVERDGVCSGIAIKDKLVPSFEHFALQIDAMMAFGLKSQCI